MSYTVDTMELRKVMLDCGILTIAELAETAEIDRNTAGGILSGKIRPSSNVIEKIAGALSLSGNDVGRIFFSNKLA